MTPKTEPMHSRLPWTVGERCGQSIAINAEHGDPTLGYGRWKALATVNGCDDDPGLGGRAMEANARFIVEACNQHASLIAQRDALRKALVVARELLDRNDIRRPEIDAALAQVSHES